MKHSEKHQWAFQLGDNHIALETRLGRCNRKVCERRFVCSSRIQIYLLQPLRTKWLELLQKQSKPTSRLLSQPSTREDIVSLHIDVTPPRLCVMFP